MTARLAMQDGNADSQADFPARFLRNPKVKRKLFVDEETTKEERGLDDNQTNLFIEENRKHLQEARQRWNFNFETETPEAGKYIWEKVDTDGNEVKTQRTENAAQTIEPRKPNQGNNGQQTRRAID